LSRAEQDRLRKVYEQRQSAEIQARYNLHQPGERYILDRRVEAFQAMLARHLPAGLAGQSVLDLGCAGGSGLAEWVDWGADEGLLIGLDLMESFIARARRNYPGMSWLVASGDRLPFVDASFAIVTQSMAVSSVLDQQMRQNIAAEMWRVLAPGGLLLWFDMRLVNPWNANIRPVGLAELLRLFPVAPLESHSLILIPPLARRLAGLGPGLCRAVESLPFLRSHRLSLFRKEEE
jgi:ubiquinone/menaquinone biosynthesis C-methylase UbiE